MSKTQTWINVLDPVCVAITPFTGFETFRDGPSNISLTILTEVKTYIECYQTESFGPVLICLEVDTLEEAIDLISQNRSWNWAPAVKEVSMKRTGKPPVLAGGSSKLADAYPPTIIHFISTLSSYFQAGYSHFVLIQVIGHARLLFVNVHLPLTNVNWKDDRSIFNRRWHHWRLSALSKSVHHSI
ncbi:hypothetical protein P175DRAFT_0559802 [Aspergillus ochraceoroseus IBT 24754]|uniref:Aldehyde dehydrogenase domain-containing protein n=1 Tax=Aspergillus ochraceoroseus IBT 24754 TaxID=1392256 RepID=A0A2T5LRR7_9EURO|nr:uncharacterized protein P175DRAFT_0559802 [Aspergillus ochraceoroseus IBT 24754]PTU18977.1 hypothetical protein P175DRAFT_0559802 [Aspergillus ochraceoroseus IBT 24754]